MSREDAAKGLEGLAQKIRSGDLSLVDMRLSADSVECERDGWLVHKPTGTLRLAAVLQTVAS